jgi:hypothetical protein
MLAANGSTLIDRLPLGIRVWGGIAILSSAGLAGRLVWEQTALTWRYGPQMVGFSLVHGSGAILLLSPLLLLSWLVVVVTLTVRAKVKSKGITWKRWAAFAFAFIVLGGMLLPYGFWQRVFVARLASSARVSEFVIYAAATGDLGTVKALIAHGVPVDITDHDGKTALHAAAVQGQLEVIQYLTSKGANVNAVDHFGDSPLGIAISEKHNNVAQFLIDHGGRMIYGDATHRQKAIEDSVRDDIERINRTAK